MVQLGRQRRTVVLDVDGTLVDSVYLHVRAWAQLFREIGLEVPSHRIHGAIGMGGDRLVAHVAGQATEDAWGDTLRSRHRELVMAHLDEINPTRGVVDLLEELHSRGMQMVVASSSDAEMTAGLLDRAGAASFIHDEVTGDETEHSKPDPESVEQALARVGGAAVLMLGDAPWDAEAATAAGVPCVGVRTGGFADGTLLEAGCVRVLEDPADVLAHLDELLDPA